MLNQKLFYIIVFGLINYANTTVSMNTNYPFVLYEIDPYESKAIITVKKEAVSPIGILECFERYLVQRSDLDAVMNSARNQLHNGAEAVYTFFDITHHNSPAIVQSFSVDTMESVEQYRQECAELQNRHLPLLNSFSPHRLQNIRSVWVRPSGSAATAPINGNNGGEQESVVLDQESVKVLVVTAIVYRQLLFVQFIHECMNALV